MSFAMFKAACDLILHSEGDKREAFNDELKEMLYRYLAPYLGTGPMEIGEEAAQAAREVLAAEQEPAPAETQAHPSPGTAEAASGRALPTSI
jgi:hypothetical protein